MKIIENMNYENMNNNETFTNYADVYIKLFNIFYRLYNNVVYIIDITEALKIGKTCKKAIIDYKYGNNMNMITVLKNIMEDNSIKDYKIFFETALKGNLNITDNNISYDIREVKAIETFTPFLEQKKIKIPTKWNIPHIYKAILSKQITEITKNYHYTDDYKSDAACNCGKGKKVDLMEFAKIMVEDKGGYWIQKESENEKQIILSVNCHTFDSNNLIFNK
jgi:hypothetical protein